MNNFPLNFSKGRILFEKYKIIKSIEKNTFIEIYLGKNINTNELYIIKIEKKIKRKKKGILETEFYFLNLLKSQGIPLVKQIGYFDHNNIISIQSYLGLSLSQIFDKFFRCFNIKDITMIAIQILEKIKFIHSKNVIHCNINMDNLFIDFLHFNNIIYLSGFNTAIKLDNNFNKNKNILHKNNTIFSSINSMKGIKLSKKDDLENLGYVLIYLLKGELPWELIDYNLNLNEKEKIRKIYQIKKYIALNNLCEGIPDEFKLFINYIKELKSKDEIDYNYCFNLFYNIFKNNNIINDGIFSWYQEKKDNNNKAKKNFNKLLWKKKFLQKSTSYKELFFNKKRNILKKSNSCFLKTYNYNYFLNIISKPKKNNKNEIKIIENETNKIILSNEEKDYSIEGELDEEEKIKTYCKKKPKKIIKKRIINNNLIRNEKYLYTDYIVKRIPYIKIKKEIKMNNKSFLKDNSSFIKTKKRNSLIIKDLIFNNIKQNANPNKTFLSTNPSQKRLINKTKIFGIQKTIKVAKKSKNKTIILRNKSRKEKKENNYIHNNTPIKQIINKNYINYLKKPLNTISNNNINEINKPRILKNMCSNKIVKNKIIYPYLSQFNSENDLNKKRLKKDSCTIIHNSISNMNLIQNISNIYVTKSYFEEPKNVYVKPKNININKRKIKNLILKIKDNKKKNKNEPKSEKEKTQNMQNYYYLNN